MESKNKHQMFHQNIPYLDAKELDCGHHIIKIFAYEILMPFVQKYQQICSVCNISWIFNFMFIKKNAQRKPENKQVLSLIAPFKTTCPVYDKTSLNSVAFECCSSSKVLH